MTQKLFALHVDLNPMKLDFFPPFHSLANADDYDNQSMRIKGSMYVCMT